MELPEALLEAILGSLEGHFGALGREILERGSQRRPRAHFGAPGSSLGAYFGVLGGVISGRMYGRFLVFSQLGPLEGHILSLGRDILERVSQEKPQSSFWTSRKPFWSPFWGPWRSHFWGDVWAVFGVFAFRALGREISEKGGPGEASELILGLPGALLELILGSLEEAFLGGCMGVFWCFWSLAVQKERCTPGVRKPAEPSRELENVKPSFYLSVY